MAERVTFDAEPRTLYGRKSKLLRREGFIPAVIYGQREPIHIQINRLPLRRALRQAGTNELIDIKVDGQTLTVLAREIQQHPTRGDLIHVDFFEVNMRQSITAEAPLVLVGEPDPELRTMGTVTQLLHSVEIECLPGDLVHQIDIDISNVKTPDDILYAGDIELPKGLTLLTDPETAITSFDYFREEVEEVEEEAVTEEEVEVIGRARDEDEAFEEEG